MNAAVDGFGGAFIDATGTAASAFVIGVKGAAPSQSAVFFERVTLTNAAGAAGGRLLENYGTLQLYGVTITKGDVTGNQHPSGIGGGIYNAGAITSGEGCVITGNRARRGGGVYNDAGTIDDLFSTTISSNFASQAGGGIYNAFTGPTTYGKILSGGLTITQNKARTGGGIFNRGWIELTASSITSNATLSTGNSDESCTGVSCDGTGGGVVSVHGTKANMNTSAVVTRFNLMDGSEISGNTATLRGGAISSAGALQLTGFTMNSNTAPDGAAIYVVSPTDGSGEYCTIAGDDGVQDGPAAIIGNIANPGYSILSGGVVHDSFRCTFAGSPNYLVARGNSSPKLCNPIALNQVSTCPVQTP
jgi:predicted outer membrane repeat protein